MDVAEQIRSELQSQIHARLSKEYRVLKKIQKEHAGKVQAWEKKHLPAQEDKQPAKKRQKHQKAINLRKDAVRSEKELEEVLLYLKKEERQNPKTKWINCAAVLPGMDQADARKKMDSAYTYTNTNMLVSPAEAEEQMRLLVECGRAWPQKDKEIYREKLSEYGKDFHRIAQHFPGLSKNDCVLFYYLNKKELQKGGRFRDRQNKGG